MAFFMFRQNNSGGGFVFDEKRGLSQGVIIEANDVDDANRRAESIGIYFDGCLDGTDCDCCGDRWYRVYRPMSDERLENEISSFYGVRWVKGPTLFVHYLDGKVEACHDGPAEAGLDPDGLVV